MARAHNQQVAHPLPDDEARDRVWSLIDSIKVCMFGTWTGERLISQPMTARSDRGQGRVCFLMDAHAGKIETLERHPWINLAFADTRGNKYVSVAGRASISNDRGLVHSLWTTFDRAWWKSPQHPDIRVLVVDVDDAELWDGPNMLVAGINMLAAAVTDSRPSLGTNQKLADL